MARKTLTVTIPPPEEGASNRDAGKVFLLTEMPASDGERWGFRALLALARAGIEIPEDIANAGMAGVHAVGGLRLNGSLHPEDVEPLLEDMMACVQRIPDPKHPEVIRALVEDDIEEVATRLRLRGEVMQLHLGFSIAGVLSTLGASAKSRMGASSSTPIAPAQSEPSFPPESPA